MSDKFFIAKFRSFFEHASTAVTEMQGFFSSSIQFFNTCSSEPGHTRPNRTQPDHTSLQSAIGSVAATDSIAPYCAHSLWS